MNRFYRGLARPRAGVPSAPEAAVTRLSHEEALQGAALASGVDVPSRARSGEILPPPRMGTVIVFPPGMSRRDAEAVIQELVDHKLIDTRASHPRIETFDPEMGGPVWYVP